MIGAQIHFGKCEIDFTWSALMAFSVVAGLDLSLTRSGVAVIRANKEVEFFSVGYKLKKTASEHDRLRRILHISKGIAKVLAKNKVQYVGVENYAFGSKGLIVRQAELSGVLKTHVLIATGNCPHTIAPQAVRKYLLNKSTNEKTVVKQGLLDLGYPEPDNLDESDALAVAHLVCDWVNFRQEVDSLGDKYKSELLKSMDANVAMTSSI